MSPSLRARVRRPAQPTDVQHSTTRTDADLSEKHVERLATKLANLAANLQAEPAIAAAPRTTPSKAHRGKTRRHQTRLLNREVIGLRDYVSDMRKELQRYLDNRSPRGRIVDPSTRENRRRVAAGDISRPRLRSFHDCVIDPESETGL